MERRSCTGKNANVNDKYAVYKFWSCFQNIISKADIFPHIFNIAFITSTTLLLFRGVYKKWLQNDLNLLYFII